MKPFSQMHVPVASWHVLPLVALSVLHAALSIWFHYDRAWRGDEWGTYLAFDQSYSELVSHFGGWLTMNFYLAALKWIHARLGGVNWLLVAPGILAGCWLVYLTGAIARRLGGSTGVALSAAALAATNAYLVAFSVTIRVYIFLAAFTAAMLLGLLSWRQHGRWRDGIVCGAMALLAFLASVNALYSLIALGLLAVCWTMSDGDENRWGKFSRLAIPVAILVACGLAAYWPQMADMRRFREVWSDAPPTPPTYLPTVFTSFLAPGWLALPFVAALVVAVWRIIRSRRESQWLLLAMVAMAVSISLAGVSHYPHAYARFLIGTLPLLLVVFADGVWIARPGKRMISVLCVALLILCNLAALRDKRAGEHALPWHKVADYLRKVGPTEDYVVLGPEVYNMALRVYGLQAPSSVANVLASAASDQPLRLNVVDAVDGLLLAPADAQFGELRIVRLQGLPRDIADRMIALLSAGANGRVSGGLVPVYTQLRAISAWTGNQGDASKYERLRQRSLLRSDRMRSVPRQFLDGEQGNHPPLLRSQGEPGAGERAGD